MNQFKLAWVFMFKNLGFFVIITLPVIVAETLAAYVLLPMDSLITFQDIIDYIDSNSLIIIVSGIASILLQVAFVGGVWVAYFALDNSNKINPFEVLVYGFKKFFPLFGAFLIVSILTFIGYLFLFLPGIYLAARFSLFPAAIMFEDKNVSQAIQWSWNATDKYALKLFIFTSIFLMLILILVLIITTSLDQGLIQIGLLSYTEYFFGIPLGYIYFTLYKSIKST
ncbi:MAG: hypothetical protein CMD58_01405 [Gammaproteobacteria bacterium]|nr:hypothetical protein [Gammaproteobacteria bacterium]|tara:strand:- start:902 stop:1576 length:675 start_codon:yes stop_codon:yes gene_type:complete